MSTQAAVLALVLLVAVVVVTGKGGTLAGLPFKLAWAIGAAVLKGLVKLAAVLARWLGFRPLHLPGLAVTALLVFQAAPITGFRLPLAMAVTGWLVWVRRPGRSGRSPRWLRRAERAYADALRDAAKGVRGQTRKEATPKPTTPTRPTPPTPTRPTTTSTPAPARPAAGRRAPRRRGAAKPRPARPGSPKPAASASYWTPPPLAAEPVWPRWLGGGRRPNNRRQTP